MSLFIGNKIKLLSVIMLCSFMFEITNSTFLIMQGDEIENVEKEEEGKKENETEIEIYPKITNTNISFLATRYKSVYIQNGDFCHHSQKLKSSFIFSFDLPPELI